MASGAVPVADRLEPARYGGDRLIPADLLEFASAFGSNSLHGIEDFIRPVDPRRVLHHLPADHSPCDRVVWIAEHADDAAFFYLGQQAAAVGTITRGR